MDITDKDYGFIITRHVNSSKTNEYWNHSVKLLRALYPTKQIIIIDDNSDYNFVKAEFEYKNVQIIQSEFPKRGELLPYYYFLKNQYFSNAVIIHDSVFFHRRIRFDKLVKEGTKVLPLWFFHSDTDNLTNTLRIARHLFNFQDIQRKLTQENSLLGLPIHKWSGCFGVQSFINLQFLKYIDAKYHIGNLISAVHCRSDRCSLERIFGCIFSTECPKVLQQRSLLGDIMKYYKWGYTYEEYQNDVKNKRIPRMIVKVWTGR